MKPTSLLWLAVIVLVVLSPIVAAEEPPPAAMTNVDVVNLTKLGLGDDLVIAKIQAAAQVDFKTELVDLETLKNEGVSPAVITAMVKRQAGGSAPPPAAATAENSVTLFTKDHGEIALTSVAGSVSSTYAFVTVLVHTNFEGLKSEIRTTDRRPSLTLRTAKPPAGRWYLVVTEVDTDDRVRSVKVGNMGVFKGKNLNAPDKDNRIDCDVVEVETGLWRLTPKKDLKPGEYGLWCAAPAEVNAGGGELYDFGVD